MYLPKNAQDEALMEIAKQLKIQNEEEILYDLYTAGLIDREEYERELLHLLKSA